MPGLLHRSRGVGDSDRQLFPGLPALGVHNPRQSATTQRERTGGCDCHFDPRFLLIHHCAQHCRAYFSIREVSPFHCVTLLLILLLNFCFYYWILFL